ncbi:FAD-dependent oxidoreductase [Dyadobacter sp. CY323]|uniref:FAD-dependent oxidoreductase n=1 Tax=Dyadobacter sp. CY323 TaxID=2907302 RepID=UPI001F1A98BB|nr:FAD-dependent oxidoreductase [Dyadobacter sp. CY323]MCE6989574.1 FAD-dependent oxidoreductase [Dyadobacter sp. CY323]
MKRRKFLNLSIPTFGAALVGGSLIGNQSYAEIARQFSETKNSGPYDLIINGAGLAGYFAATEAIKKGKKVLIVEKRTSPGYDIWAKGKLWIDKEDLDKWNQELIDAFLPKEELAEVENKQGQGIGNSLFGNDLLLFNGSIRKALLKNMLEKKVDVLLMTDVCGILTADNRVSGVMVATKQGTFKIDCNQFIDASDQLLFSRAIAGEQTKFEKAGFVLEISGASNPERKTVTVSSEYGIRNNSVEFHPGKRSVDQLFIAYEFDVNSSDIDDLEHKARKIAGLLGKSLKGLDSSLSKAAITETAFETSYTLANKQIPKVSLKGYYTLSGGSEKLSGREVSAIQKSAADLIGSIKYSGGVLKAKTLVLAGAQVPMTRVQVSEDLEPGLAIPVRRLSLNWAKEIKKVQQCQVLVAGGGTAGALAAQGAIQKGADTIVVDYFNDLGGTKTMGGVMGYYHGFVENKFFKLQSAEAERVASEANMTKKMGRKIYHLQGIVGKGGKFVTGALICGAITDQNKVEGAVVCRNGVLELLKAHVTIDATGDGDLAAFAGAEFQIGNERLGETQNYSQWDIAGKGKLPSVPNRDYDIIDNTQIAEQQRGLFISHYEAHHYNFHPFLTVRESRRIVGTHVLDLIDCAENRHFEDVISLASSDFDPHNIAPSEYSKCGFLLPHSNDITIEVPYRCLVPKKLDGLLLAGRGFSQTQNALQFTRMTADLLVLGFLTGQIAADVAWKKVQPRQYNISELQREWSSLGYLPEDVLKRTVGDLRDNKEEVNRRIGQLAAGAPEYLYECSRIPKSTALPLLKAKFESTDSKEGKLLLGKALAWFGADNGVSLIVKELEALFDQETETGYPKGYVDDYDFIRGRKKNMLEGLFWKINQNIALLAMSGSSQGTDLVSSILENTQSGGGMVKRSSAYYDNRIDLKIVPFHNRILGLCFYADRIPDAKLISGFEKILKDKNVGNFQTTKYENVRWRVYGGSLEVNIAAALARCGGKTGYQLLHSYLDDIHSNFRDFASRELAEVTRKNYGFATDKWGQYIADLKYPQAVTPLAKEVHQI